MATKRGWESGVAEAIANPILNGPFDDDDPTSRSVHTVRRASWFPGDDQANRSSRLHSHERHAGRGSHSRPSTST